MFTLVPLDMQPIKHVYVQSPKQTVSDTDFKQGSLVNSAQAISHIKQSNAFLVCMAKQGSSFHARLHTRQVSSLLRDKSIKFSNTIQHKSPRIHQTSAATVWLQ